MLELLMSKGFMIWLELSIFVWALVYRNSIILYIKDLFGGYLRRPPKDKDETPKEDK